MLSVKVISPKINTGKHKPNLSQPTITKYNNLNSFNEYFRSQKINQRASQNNNQGINNSRCKTDSRLFENYSISTKRMSRQSSTLCLSNTKSQSTSPKTINLSSTMNFKSQTQTNHNSSQKIKQQRSPEQAFLLSFDFKKQFDQLLLKTKTLISQYKKKEQQFIKREKELNQEILKLKTRIEIQNRLLTNYNIPHTKF